MFNQNTEQNSLSNQRTEQQSSTNQGVEQQFSSNQIAEESSTNQVTRTQTPPANQDLTSGMILI